MIELPPLPYAKDALEPTMSAETLTFHHDKHHAAYVEKTNTLAKEAGLDGEPLETIITKAHEAGNKKLFNNAAQAWNHTFFWNAMTPEASNPGEALAEAIRESFGEMAELKKQFVEAGVGHFGSGWVWLAATKGGKLSLVDTHDADTLVVRSSLTPLLVCDVWEHAYYLDKQNDRKAYLEAWFDNLANWTFADAQFASLEDKGEAFAA